MECVNINNTCSHRSMTSLYFISLQNIGWSGSYFTIYVHSHKNYTTKKPYFITFSHNQLIYIIDLTNIFELQTETQSFLFATTTLLS